MSSALPSAEVRTNIIDRLTDLIKALESHPAMRPPAPNRGVHHVRDFVQQSRYTMTELENIRDGKPLQHPEQVKLDSGLSGPAAAAEALSDVCGRTAMVSEMISNPRLVTMMGLPPVDFGSDVKAKAEAAVAAVEAT